MSDQTDQTLEKKRQDFKSYLIKSGVFEALTKALISIYEMDTKPADPLNYIRTHMSEEDEGLKILQAKYDSMVTEIQEMEEENMNLAKSIREMQPIENYEDQTDEC